VNESWGPKRRVSIPRSVLVGLAIAPAVIAVGIFGFIARYSLAHDEARCPFSEVETRASGEVQVREESRRCLPEIEEHRWLAIRDGRAPLELGRYPLEAERVEHGFPWEVRQEEGRAVVTVINEGRGEIVFREPPPEQR
jgi:hypothetical protein